MFIMYLHIPSNHFISILESTTGGPEQGAQGSGEPNPQEETSYRGLAMVQLLHQLMA